MRYFYATIPLSQAYKGKRTHLHIHIHLHTNIHAYLRILNVALRESLTFTSDYQCL